MIAMGHRFVTAVRSMNMAITIMHRDTAARIGVADFDHMLIDMIFVRMVQVTIMKIVHVVAMLDRRMATAWTMLMGVIFVLVTSHEMSPRVLSARRRTRRCDQRYLKAGTQYNYRNKITVIA